MKYGDGAMLLLPFSSANILPFVQARFSVR